MARQEFERIDLIVAVRVERDGSATLVQALSRQTGEDAAQPVIVPRAPWYKSVARETVRNWLNPAHGLGDLSSLLEPEMLSDWRAVEQTAGYETIRRVALYMDAPQLAALDWETALTNALPQLNGAPIVRLTNNVPRALTRPLTLPLHLVEIADAPFAVLDNAVRGGLGWWANHVTTPQAIQWFSSPLAQLTAELAQREWRVIDVLHITNLPAPRNNAWLALGAPDEPGTLGWLTRLVNLYLPRLVVLNAAPHIPFAMLRTMVLQLAASGGPAVMVGDFSGGNASLLYDALVHDTPLDVVWARADRMMPSVFVAGGGREDALRISNIGRQLANLQAEINLLPRGAIDLSGLLRKFFNLSDLSVPSFGPRDVFMNDLELFEQQWKNMNFAHESGGLLPTAEGLEQLRRRYQRQLQTGTVRGGKGVERFLNAYFCGQNLQALDTETTQLQVGQMYQVGVQIGPKDEKLQIISLTPLDEKNFAWQPDVQGRWLQVGIVGMDFFVVGASLQELWLPRNGDSDVIYFTVIPQTRGAVRLRVILYYQNNVLQTLRLASTAYEQGDAPMTLLERRKMLADALEIPETELRNAGYAARVEFNLVSANEANLRERAPRALSLVVNDKDGQTIVTHKTSQQQATTLPDNSLKDYVRNVRECLDEIAGKVGNKNEYGFLQNDNSGTRDDLKPKLAKLADAGWQMYSHLVDENGLQVFEDALAQPNQTIQVAHILLERVIPWAAMYDRPYDPRRSTMPNSHDPVDHDVCFAPMPNADGTLPNVKCGEHPNCVLHSAQRQARLQNGQNDVLPETVVCPLHFWGFKHVIELPPQELTTADASGTPSAFDVRTCVQSVSPAQMLMAYNPGLFYATTHRDTLLAMPRTIRARANWSGAISERDVVIDRLATDNLDLIYFYCHAIGGEVDQQVIGQRVLPYLEFNSDLKNPNPAMRIYEQDFKRVTWAHHPLVIMNACHTAGFSYNALSPFILLFVRRRGASGVLGTEVAVWEQIAREVGELFVERFLQGHHAGEALLDVRRILLSKNNPLGLIYTLYASADLQLDVNGNRCA